MSKFRVWIDKKDHEQLYPKKKNLDKVFEAADMNKALDLAAQEMGFIDVADMHQELCIADSIFNIVEI